MTKENLLKYLRDPIYLQQISYQELKTLVAEHPNSLSLRYLLAVKSKQENNSDFERQLAYLATYGFDRAHLFDVFNKQQEVSEEIVDIALPEEDYLELKELSALERELTTKPLTRTNDLIFEMETPTPATPIPTTAHEEHIEEISNLEQEDYYVLNFDEELNTSMEEGPAVLESKVEGNLAAIEDLFKDLEEGEPASEEQVVSAMNGASTDLELQETVEGGDFPEIPLEVLDTNVDVVGEEFSQMAILGVSNQQEGGRTKSLDKDNTVPEIPTDTTKEIRLVNPNSKSNVDIIGIGEDTRQIEAAGGFNGQKEVEGTQTSSEIIPDTTEETLIVNPIPKSSFSTWYEQNREIPSFSGFDLVGFNSKGIIKELSASEKELQIAEQIREEKLRLAKLQAAKRADSVRETRTIITTPIRSINNGAISSPALQPKDAEPEKKDKSKKKKKKQKQILKEIKNEAETSIVFEDDIASETLAQLLVLQGHYSKARAMYEHLSLIFPEKSGLFAYEIQKIENLEDEVA